MTAGPHQRMDGRPIRRNRKRVDIRPNQNSAPPGVVSPPAAPAVHGPHGPTLEVVNTISLLRGSLMATQCRLAGVLPKSSAHAHLVRARMELARAIDALHMGVGS